MGSQPGAKSRGTAGGALGVAVVLGCASAWYQRRSERDAAEEYPPPGRLVDVGRRRLHVQDHGGDGVPIVIETGAGTLARTWEDMIPRLTALGRVITYDRAGYGWSDAPGWRRDGLTVADDLRALLDDVGVTEPIVLIGHSLGGLYARSFASLHPERVAGLVLVDSTHEDMLDRIRHQFGSGALVGQLAFSLAMTGAPRGALRAGMALGFVRERARNLVGGDTDDELRLRTALYLRSAFRKASLLETLSIPRTMRYLRARADLGSLPLAVVTAADPADDDNSYMARFRPAWLAMQRDLATRSTTSWHLIAESGGHFVYQDDPETVERAVALVVDQLRTSST